MAKQVADFVVRLGLEGDQDLERFKSQFRELGRVVNVSGGQIDTLRQRILDYNRDGQRSEQLIRGQLDALRALRSQVDVAGTSYQALSTDIRALDSELRGSTRSMDAQRDAILRAAASHKGNAAALSENISALERLQARTREGSAAYGQFAKDIQVVKRGLDEIKKAASDFNTTVGQIPGASIAKLSGQIDRLRTGMRDLTILSDKFLSGLERTQLLQAVQSRFTGRQEVRAAAAMYASPAYTNFVETRAANVPLPDTTAALNLRLQELQTELSNTERSSARYTRVALELADVQRQLNTQLIGTSEAFKRLDAAQAGIERRAAKLAQVQQYYSESSQVAPGISGYRDPTTGAIIARGAYEPGRTRVAESAYERPIGPEPLSQESRRSLAALEDSLNTANGIYERSRLEQAQLQAKYNQLQLDADEAAYQESARRRQIQYDQDLRDFDRRLEAGERRRRGRVSGVQLAQAAGAAVSGGIFGGFEGFAGGVLGGVIGAGTPAGPVGGAFAGAAIGAQAGMIRQQIGATATYAAEISRLRIALSGVVTDLDEYRTAVRATEQIADRFNLPLGESTQRFTQLAAAVAGSGGTIEQAKETFNNITAAIIATGGSTEQVNAALTAMSQVFSKGKATAEELRGQLGERLPGAFATFAASMGISTQELDKLLDSGKVTISDVLKFVKLLGKQYGETADLMAKSSEQAGARMNRAMDKLRITTGSALGTTGAAFQDFFTDIITYADKAIRKLVELNLLRPGANYRVARVLSGEETVGDVDKRIAALEKERQLLEKQQRDSTRQTRGRSVMSMWFNPNVEFGEAAGTAAAPGAFAGVRAAPGAFPAKENPRLAEVREELRIEREVRARLALFRTPREDEAQAKQDAEEQAAKDREQRAKQYLDAIEQRETSLLDARRDYEEQIRDIRKNALREAEQLERGFADERRNIEREVRDIRTQRADTAEDNERRLRIARGENADVVNAAQRVAEIYRKERDDNQKMTDRIADAERTQARTIADFQRKNAEDINRANETYAKRIGEIQRNYAVTTSKILEEGSANGAKRLAVAAQLISLRQQRTAPRYAGYPLPSDYAGAEPLYGTAGMSARAIENASTDPDRVVVSQIDRRIRALELSLTQPPSGPSAAAVALPRTPAPNLGRLPALPGAAQTTAARSELAAESRAANAQDRLDSSIISLVEATQPLRAASAELTKRAAVDQLRGIYEPQGYGTETLQAVLAIYTNFGESARALADSYTKSQNELYEAFKRGDVTFAERKNAIDKINAAFEEQKKYLEDSYNLQVKSTLELGRQNEALRYRQDLRIGTGATEGLREYITTIGTASEASKQLALGGIKGVENAIVDLATTGTTNFREFAQSMIQDTVRMITQQFILRSVLSLLNFAQPAASPAAIPSADLDKYSTRLLGPYTPVAPTYPGVPQFAQGGIATGPASGYPAVLHGTEAVIPLSGSRAIPVQMQGTGSAPIININVDATGTAVQGNQGQAQDLARDLAAVVDDRLVYHRRRGGLLDPQR